MASLWGLPGPGRFVEDVADDLRGGSSVVLRFGGNQPAALAVHLQQLTDWSVSWMRLDANSEASRSRRSAARPPRKPAPPTWRLLNRSWATTATDRTAEMCWDPLAV